MEYVPDLSWPTSIAAYTVMRADAQLSALFKAMTMPIRRFKFMIDPNGARATPVKQLSQDLGLDVVGKERQHQPRQKGRFSFEKHLYHALLAGIYGHMYFEQVGEIQNSMWRLKKLAPRMPETILEFRVSDDGGLQAIRQRFTGNGMLGYVEIPVDRLVAYIIDQEGANWVGRSWLRDCYRNWLIKDRLMRVDAINHERAGGVPWIEAAPGATPAEIQQMSEMAQSFKIGEESGGAVPSGSALNIARLGSGTDVVNSMRYHDESMARAFLHMFLQLGQTVTGSRALGDTFVEYAFIAQKAVAQWFVDVFNEHVIEDWMDWNYGEDVEQVPLLTYVVQEEDELLPVEDLVKMVQANVIHVDPDLEESLRERFKLPDLPADHPSRQMLLGPQPPELPPPSGNGGVPAVVRETARQRAVAAYETTIMEHQLNA